jgi:hypothetical protein
MPPHGVGVLGRLPTRATHSQTRIALTPVSAHALLRQILADRDAGRLDRPEFPRPLGRFSKFCRIVPLVVTIPQNLPRKGAGGGRGRRLEFLSDRASGRHDPTEFAA